MFSRNKLDYIFASFKLTRVFPNIVQKCLASIVAVAVSFIDQIFTILLSCKKIHFLLLMKHSTHGSFLALNQAWQRRAKSYVITLAHQFVHLTCQKMSWFDFFFFFFNGSVCCGDVSQSVNQEITQASKQAKQRTANERKDIVDFPCLNFIDKAFFDLDRICPSI